MQKEKQENRSCRPGRTHRAWKKNHLIFVFLLAMMPWISEAQNNPAPVQYYKQPVRLSFGNQVVGFPFQNLFTSFHPGLMAGTEFGYNKSEKHRICQTLNLGFSFSRQIGNNVMLSSDFCYRIPIRRELSPNYLLASECLTSIMHAKPINSIRHQGSITVSAIPANSGRCWATGWGWAMIFQGKAGSRFQFLLKIPFLFNLPIST